MHASIEPTVAVIAGVLILAVPRLLNYIVALYLIIIGITGLAR
jgi:threonine/homoserine efflux transporter RhtA